MAITLDAVLAFLLALVLSDTICGKRKFAVPLNGLGSLDRDEKARTLSAVAQSVIADKPDDLFCVEFPQWMLKYAPKFAEIISGSESITISTHSAYNTLSAILASLDWLANYRVFRVQQKHSRDRRQDKNVRKGTAQIFIGAEQSPPPIESTWTAELYDDTLYLSHMKRGALVLSPFLQYRDNLLYLFARVLPEDTLELKNWTTNNSISCIISEIEGANYSWNDIIEGNHGINDDRKQSCSFSGGLYHAQNGGSFLSDIHRIVGVLGQGAAGTVWEVEHVATKERSAMKALLDGHSSVSADRFRREAEIVSRIQHPNFVKSKWIQGRQGRHLIEMEIIRGGTLANVISSNPHGLPEEAALVFANQLIDALAYLEESAVVHRDLKPSNILVTEKMEVKIIDFGVATEVSDGLSADHTIAREIVGTEGYLAPEQLVGRAHFTSDLYAAARILAQLRTGGLPDSQCRASAHVPAGHLADILELFDDPEIERRMTARRVQAILRTLRSPRATVDHPREMGVNGANWAHVDRVDTTGLWIAGSDLRQRMNACEGIPTTIITHIPKDAQNRFLDIWDQLRRDHIGSAWVQSLDKIRVRDLMQCSKLKFDPRWVYSLLAGLPTKSRLTDAQALSRVLNLDASELHSHLQGLPAATLDLREWVTCRKRKRFPGQSSFGCEVRMRLGLLLARQMNAGRPDDEQLDDFIADDTLFPGILDRINEPRYQRMAMPKKSGGKRWIHAPNPELRTIQEVLAKHVALDVNWGGSGTAFIAGRSPVVHAHYHAGAQAAVVVDIHDFFGSIHSAQVGMAIHYMVQAEKASIFVGWSPSLSHRVLDLCFVKEATRRLNFLPQGSPCSPALANLVGCVLDNQIESAMESNWTYSRYADDIVISSRFGGHHFHKQATETITRAVQDFGWHITPGKVRHWSSARGGPLELCGIIVAGERKGSVGLPGWRRKAIRVAVHRALHGHAKEQEQGLISYGYSITGDHALRASIPGATKQRVEELGNLIAGGDDASTRLFWEGWINKKNPA